ncbi:MAG: phosphate transporter [Fusobacteriia bacterium 4572_74]|nr:MAG: phosphate transporter [Fusobacteriia bacterium 4572_74]
MGLDIFFDVIGGLGIFLYGMHHMSSGMQKIAGAKIKSIIGLLTKNRIIACIVGVLVTAMVQSSSVSTVMTIGFVNASLMSLKQALGVILGANIGTTVTGWILVLKIGKYGLPMVGIAAIFYLFAKNEKVKTKLLTFMGLGMIFFGLELMSSGFKPLRTMPFFIELFHSFDATSGFGGVISAALVGALLTAIVQSSSATLGITIVLASQGMINSETAVALVLGENVGTTVTAMLASLGARANAKRAAVAHTIINVIGVTWVVSIFPYYLQFLSNFVDPVTNITKYVATAHTMFNVTNVLIFLPFIGYIAKILKKMIVEKEEVVKKLTQLDERMLETPDVVVEQTKLEINKIGTEIVSAFGDIKKTFKENLPMDSKEFQNVLDLEDRMDIVQGEIASINSKVLALGLEAPIIKKARKNIAISDQYESVTDYLKRIAFIHQRLFDNDQKLSKKNLEELEKIHTMTVDLFDYVDSSYKDENYNILREATKRTAAISNLYKEIRRKHLDRMAETTKSPILVTGYMDILNHYKRLSDHSLTVVEILNV